MESNPVVAIHLTAALAALATGPVALWARLGPRQRPRLYRAFGIAWVLLMLVTALSALFIRDPHLPDTAGFTPIHLLVPLALGSLFVAFRPLAPIVQQTPVWVWALLAALVILGWLQSRDRTASLAAVSGVPVGMTLFGLWGTIGALGRTPLMPEALALWLLAAGTVAALLAQRPARAWYDRATRTFDLAGSWWPLLLFVLVFAVRYSVAVQIALHPWLVEQRAFALPVALLHGAFSGIFLGRAVQLWRLALRPQLAVAG